MLKSFLLERVGTSFPQFIEINNHSKIPDSFKVRCKLEVVCQIHGSFLTDPMDYISGKGCADCRDIELGHSRGVKRFATLLEMRYPGKFTFTVVGYRNQRKIELVCREHGTFSKPMSEFLAFRHICPECTKQNNRDILIAAGFATALKMYSNQYHYPTPAVKSMKDTLNVVCPKHGLFRTTLENHISYKKSCMKCSREDSRLTTQSFIDRATLVHAGRYDYTKTKYLVYSDKLTITCRVHGDFQQRAGSHLQGNGCIECFLEVNKLPKETFVENARKVHGDKFDYSKVIYLGNKKKVEIICPTHGSFWQMPNSHVSSRTGCRYCSESKGEVAVEVFLNQLGIPHVREHRILPYKYRYDFYIPDANVYIEYHGHQHYRPVEIFGGDKAFRTQKRRDAIKRKLVADLNGSLVVMNYLALDELKVGELLTAKLKRLYKKWYLYEGKLLVFSKITDAYKHFKIPSDIEVRLLDAEIRKRHPTIKVIF